MSSSRIAILIHQDHQSFTAAEYYIHLLMKAWQDLGFIVEVVRGITRHVPADVIVSHVDLTTTPAEYLEYMDRYPVAVNKNVVTIAKSAISANKVVRGDGYDGPVIVKTDRNYGGIPEQVLTPPDSLPRRIIRKLGAKLWNNGSNHNCWKSRAWIEAHNYPVYPTVGDMPPDVFGNEHFIVEKFLPEMQGDDYCLRCYLFCGDRDLSLLLRSKQKIIKAENAHERVEVEVHPELRLIRKQLGFDFGKFDYVVRDGKVVLFDVNRTPCYYLRDHITNRVVSHLCEGIESFLGVHVAKSSGPWPAAVGAQHPCADR